MILSSFTCEVTGKKESEFPKIGLMLWIGTYSSAHIHLFDLGEG